STADFAEKGYTDDDTGAFRAPGLTPAEAPNNAESYARFVMMTFLFPCPARSREARRSGAELAARRLRDLRDELSRERLDLFVGERRGLGLEHDRDRERLLAFR